MIDVERRVATSTLVQTEAIWRTLGPKKRNLTGRNPGNHGKIQANFLRPARLSKDKRLPAVQPRWSQAMRRRCATAPLPVAGTVMSRAAEVDDPSDTEY